MSLEEEPARHAPGVVRVIAPGGRLSLGWGELWRYRELLYLLAWRDVNVRYKQTVLGVAWAVLQPLLTVFVFSLFFGRLAGLESRTGGIPYPVYVCAGVLPWVFFSGAAVSGGNSLVASVNLVTKVYFPRLAIPFAAVGAALVDLLVSFVVLVGMMALYRVWPTPQMLFALVPLAGLLLLALGISTLIAALTVEFRDVRYVVPFVLQMWLFLTPVIYPATLVPARWRWALYLNPLTGLIEGFRSAVFSTPLNWPSAAISLAIAVAALFVGCAYFRAVERRFADLI